jgi:hypothetical protein
VLSGNLTLAQALTEARNPKVGRAGSDTELTSAQASTRQLVTRRAAEQFIDAAGGAKTAEDVEGVVERAVQEYLKNPPQDLTTIGLPLTRQDFYAAARRQVAKGGTGSGGAAEFAAQALANLLAGQTP